MSLDRAGQWLGRVFRRARHAPRPEPAANADLNLCLELRLEASPPVWLEARGISMLPLRCRTWEAKIEPPPTGAHEIGSIVVFRRGAGLFYHRVIGAPGPRLWLTKGDTLIHPDEPVTDTDIVGRVTAMRRKHRLRLVRPDPGAAWLSCRLGQFVGRFCPPTARRRQRALRIVYLAALLCAWPFRGRLSQRMPQLTKTTVAATSQEN